MAADASESWQDFEKLARHVLMHFADALGVSEVEAKQRLKGESGTRWEVDAKAITKDGKGFLVVECKEWKTSIPQSVLGTLVYSIQDTGASGGIIVTSVGLQKGADIIAKHEGVHVVKLAPGGTFSDFLASCAKLVVRRLKPEQAHMSIGFSGGYYRAATDGDDGASGPSQAQ